MAQYQKLSCQKLFQVLTKQNKQMDQQSFSDFITKVLQLKQDDVLQFYILTHYMKAQKCGHISLANLQNLFQALKVKTVKDLKKKIPNLAQQLQKPITYKEMYKQVYSLFLIGTTTLDIDYAIALWGYLLKDRFAFLNQLREYIQQLGQKRPKKIHKDLWNMMYQFSSVVKNLGKDYSQNDAWPVFIDNFVQWMKNKNQKMG